MKKFELKLRNGKEVTGTYKGIEVVLVKTIPDPLYLSNKYCCKCVAYNDCCEDIKPTENKELCWRLGEDVVWISKEDYNLSQKEE